MTRKFDKLTYALATIGKNERLRSRFLSFCRETESILAKRDFSVRDEITGPMIDALHSDLDVLKKDMRSGIKFHFLYRSKIARDFVMSPEEAPDHVWEPQTTKLLLYLGLNARAQNVVIGGAYFGDHALLLAQTLNADGGLCHCFEPNDEQIEMLRFNAKANSLSNVVTNQIGLWDTDGAYLVLVGDDSFASPKLVNSADVPGAFPTITLNSYGKQRNIPRFEVIMLDLEGGELAALRGSDHYLSQPPGEAPHLIFEVHRNYTDWSNGLGNTEIVQYLRSKGYSLFSIRDYQSNVPMDEQPIELIKPENTYIAGPPHGFNMLGVKEEKILDSKLFRLCSGVSPKLLMHRDPKLHQPLTTTLGSR